MYLGRVVGTVVATRKADGLDGLRLLVVQPLNPDLSPRGNVVVAIDVVQAGPDEIVHLVGSREASLAVPAGLPLAPVDAAIVGIVDSVDVEARP